MLHTLFKNMKMFQKIVLVAAISILLMWFAVVTVAVTSIQSLYDKKLDRITHQTVEQTSKYVSTEFTNIINLVHYSLVGDEMQTAIRLDVDRSQEAYIKAESLICPVLTQLQLQNEFVESTAMVLKGKWFYGDNHPMSYDEIEDMIEESKLNRLIYWEDDPVVNTRNNKEVLPMILRVPNGSFSNQYEAYLVVNIECQKLFDYIRNLENNLECNLILHNGEQVIYGDEELYLERDKGRYFVNDTEISVNGWILTCIMDKTNMYADLYSAIGKMLGVSCVIAAICFALAYYISRSVVVPLGYLNNNAKKVEQGDFTVRNHFSGHDEIGDLGRSFDAMCSQIESYIQMLEEEKRQVQISEKQKRKAEMQVLQAQINPHFLYNTLDSLYWYSLSGKKDEIGQIVVDLSDMRIIKILLQPLAENSLVHGLKDMEENGFIHISGNIEGEDVVFRVRDNGCGFSAKKEEPKSEFSGYALKNIENRLKLHYEEDAVIHIHSVPYEETEVEIRIAQHRLI